MGRSAQSKATLKLHGTYREDRHGKGELPASEPSCPAWLDREGKAEWKRLVKSLLALGLNEVDRGLLSVYCESWAEWYRAVKFLRENGEWYESETQNGTIARLHPMVQVRNAAADRMLKYGSKFGLSPSARTSLNVGAPKDETENKKARFLG